MLHDDIRAIDSGESDALQLVTLPDRKAEHLRIAARPDVVHTAGTGLREIRLVHRALPPFDLSEIDLRVRLLGATLQAPLLISAMTGGAPESAVINCRLIEGAAEHGVGLTLGSGRRLLQDPWLRSTYLPTSVRPPLLLGNIGGSQLGTDDGPEQAERLIDLLDADGLSVHLNPLQEAIQPEGDPAGGARVLHGIAATVARIAPRPVVVKEVGFGLSGQDVAALAEIGVAAVDVAGAGGTNWALIEGMRNEIAGEVAAPFDDWGRPTLRALAEAQDAAPGLPVIASGGLRDGVDCAKCLALGAVAGAVARPLLLAAQSDQVDRRLTVIIRQLRIATWLTGVRTAGELNGECLQ